MTQKWNLQDIKPAKERKKRNSGNRLEPSRSVKSAHSAKKASGTLHKQRLSRGNKKRPWGYAFVIFLILVGGGIFTAIATGGAEISIHPKYHQPNVNTTFTAVHSPQPTELAFEIMSLEAEGTRQITAIGKEEVETKAMGSIIVYNKHQSNPIRLRANTRFESQGLVFRIQESIVLPGYTRDDEENILPGVITVDVFADQAGDRYNLPPSAFTIPGFAGGSEFENIYAESIATFSSGFIGKRFILDEDELKNAQQALHAELRQSLLNRIDTEKPANLIIFNNSVTFTHQSLPSVEYSEDLATIREKVTMRIPMFKKDEFASIVASETVPTYDGEAVRILDYDIFKFVYTYENTSESNIADAENISFKLSGRPKIIWETDIDKLKTDLVNQPKTALPRILGGHPSVQKAEAIISPFWKTAFPSSASQIDIIEILE